MLAAYSRSLRLLRNARRRLLSAAADDGEGVVSKKSSTNALLPLGADIPRPGEIISIPLARRPLFPGLAYPVRLQNKSVIDEVQRQMKSGSPYIAMFYRKNEPAPGQPPNLIRSLDDIYHVGTLGQVFRIVPTVSVDGQMNEAQALVMGHRRLISSAVNQIDPFSICQVEHFDEKKLEAKCSLDSTTIKAYMMEIVATMREIRSLNPMFKEQLELFLQTVEFNDPEKSGMLADIAAQLTSADGAELQEILEAFDPGERLTKALLLLKKELELSKMQSDISKQVEERINKNQRKFLLQEQLKSIKKELGLERDEKEEIVTRFRDRLKDLHPPDHVTSIIDDECNKLQHLEPSASEFNVTRNYLDWLTLMPWGVYTSEAFNVAKAKEILDAEHYGMEAVKSRILEFIAVGQLLGESPAGKILCLVGPPGVGKTSIGKSIAHSLGRKFFRFSVGGLTDVAEIKGHRRTYVGAMPGKLIQALKMTQTSNPVVLIDEIDKIGRGVQGDPSSALLEVLDPEQNGSFVDHYLDAAVDLSRVLFICTANSEDPIPKPLADRIEFIRLAGYVHEEKMAIAKRYLCSTARSKTGIKTEQVDLTDGALDALIRGYCREAGVRELAKRIDQIYRKAALKLVDGVSPPLSITEDNLHEYVGGHAVFKSELMYDELPCGVCVGLAWTSMGGSLLYIEGAVTGTQKDKGGLQYTGNLGEVMKESVQLSYSVAKQFLADIEPGNQFFRDAVIHLHAPEGAVSKEGPSAGITMVSALVSLALNKPLQSDVAMTGEISLTGKVLRIGGIKEKAIAAKRAGVKRILVPEQNRSDAEELPENVREGIEFKFCSSFNDVYENAFRSSGI